jgi:hypothetical protein
LKSTCEICCEQNNELSRGSVATANDYTSLLSQISGQSVYEIDHLIEDLKGVRDKLSNDGDRLQREIVDFEAFTQSIVQLTKVISDGMAFVDNGPTVAQVGPPKASGVQGAHGVE